MSLIDARLPLECRSDPECRALVELRDCPELMTAVAVATGSEFAVQARLRTEFPAELVPLALSLHQFRQRAAGKFTRAERMWLDRVGLEQATAEVIARHKAARFPTGEPVWDLCSGIGSDALALAADHPVTAVDLRPVACLRTLWNAEVYDVAEQIEVRLADVTTLSRPDGLIHIDPDRRAGGPSRANRLEDYLPNLEFLQNLAATGLGGAIKVGPASNFGGKFPNTEIELVSWNGECKEATVWFGELAGPQPCRATVLPSGVSLAGHPLSAAAPVTPLGEYLYDPDPAVVRAGLIDLCAEQLGLTRLDAAEEYLTANRLVDSPFVTPFRVLAELPNNDRELRRHLRTGAAADYEIKCRHIPVQADALRRRLPHGSAESLTIFVARLDGKARIVIARRI